MIDLYRYFNKPEKLDMHFVYADLIDTIISKQFRCENSFGPILHIIKRSYFYSYRYALIVIKGRWKEVEPNIMKNTLYSYYYALHVIDGRWYEAEPYIMLNPNIAHMYARWIIKDRWFEAEHYIKKDKVWWSEYNKYVLK